MNDLINFMKQKNLSVKQVAQMVNVKDATVRVWRSNPKRKIPSSKMDLLKLKVESK